MQDTKLFETILGIPTPWHVARVELKPEDERVDVWLEHEPTRWPCPNCGETLPAFDHAAERTWRHLATCQFPDAPACRDSAGCSVRPMA